MITHASKVRDHKTVIRLFESMVKMGVEAGPSSLRCVLFAFSTEDQDQFVVTILDE